MGFVGVCSINKETAGLYRKEMKGIKVHVYKHRHLYIYINIHTLYVCICIYVRVCVY